MASNIQLIEYITDQLTEAGHITYRKMFGEYGLYLNGKNIAFVCDDRLLLKPTANALNRYPNLPYDAVMEGGRKKYLRIDDIDNRAFLCELVRLTYEELPDPKPQSRKKTWI